MGKQKSKTVMYRHIERWEASGLSGRKYCKETSLTKSTFYYWLNKYRHEKGSISKLAESKTERFIPVQVSESAAAHAAAPFQGYIEVFFPNGVQVNCPSGIDIDQLKTLINF